jgi:hypothetical protein
MSVRKHNVKWRLASLVAMMALVAHGAVAAPRRRFARYFFS